MSTGKTDKNIALPASWDVRPLGEVVQPTRPRIKPSEKPNLPFIGMENIEAHTMKLLGTVPAGTMKSSAFHFQPDDVLYGRLRPYLNKVYRPDFEGLCSAEFIVFPKTESISSRYLQYFLNSSSFASYASHLNVGDRPRVDFEQLAPYPFPVAPYEQQKRIVADIELQFSRLDKAVANLKHVKTNLKRYKASILKAGVEGKLTEDWRKQHPNVEPANKLLERILAARRAQWNGRGKYKEPIALATNDLPSLPKGWTWATVEQLAAGYVGAIQSGPFGSQLLHSEFVDHGILAIGIDNVLDGKFSLGRQHRITPAKFETLRKFEARPRDVVITVMATVGRVCVLPQSLERAIITKHCYRITPVSGNVEPDFLAIALRANSATRQYIFGNVRGQTRPGINGSILKAAPVSLPPLAEQQLIVEEVERPLSVIDELEAAAEANMIRADRLRQAILSRAFGSHLPSDNSLPLVSDKEVSMKSKNLPVLPAPRETSAEDKRLDLIEVISRYPNGLPVETLFVDAGYRGDQIDQFYRDLSVFASRIEQEVPSDEDAAWPYAGLVRVRLKA